MKCHKYSLNVNKIIVTIIKNAGDRKYSGFYNVVLRRIFCGTPKTRYLPIKDKLIYILYAYAHALHRYTMFAYMT